MKLLIPLLFAFISSTCLGQFKQISGKVTDSYGAVLPGVNILVKSSGKGTVTDSDGNYSLSIKPGDKLIVSFVGYSSQEVTIAADQNVINVVVDVSADSLHGWCCTDHPGPKGPHCGRNKEDLKKEFGCANFIPDN